MAEKQHLPQRIKWQLVPKDRLGHRHTQWLRLTQILVGPSQIIPNLSAIPILSQMIWSSKKQRKLKNERLSFLSIKLGSRPLRRWKKPLRPSIHLRPAWASSGTINSRQSSCVSCKRWNFWTKLPISSFDIVWGLYLKNHQMVLLCMIRQIWLPKLKALNA